MNRKIVFLIAMLCVPLFVSLHIARGYTEAQRPAWTVRTAVPSGTAALQEGGSLYETASVPTAIITESVPSEDEPSDSMSIPVPAEWQALIDEAPVTQEQAAKMSIKDYWNSALTLLYSGAKAPLQLFARLCGIVLLTALGRSLVREGTDSTAALLDTVGALVVFTVGSATVLSLIALLQDVLQQCSDYLACFVPVFAAAMAGCGQAGTSVVYSGLFFGATSLLSGALCSVCLPATRIFLALHAAAGIGSAFDLRRLADAVAKWVKWLLAFCATLFAALFGLQSTLAQNADTAALKTGKFLVSSGVPVVGRAVSDALGGVLAGMRLLKGTLGFAAVAVLTASFVPVLVQCLLYHAAFSLAGAVAGSAGAERAGRMCDAMARCVSLYLTMMFLYMLLVISATILMILLGSGG